jgi:hypothetical protein
MRLNINLASQKFEDTHAFYVRWGSSAGLVVLLTIILAWLAWSSHTRSVQSGKRIAELQRKIADLDQKKSEAEAILNRPENHDVREESRYWNGRIAQRSFSWTQLFSDLERIMPSRTYVASVQPATTLDKRLQLKIVINGESHEDANNLLKRMKASPTFLAPAISTEAFHAGQKNSPGFWQFDIETYYTPVTALQKNAGTKEGT